MWKSIVYKEWLKIRLFLIGFTALGIVVIGYLFLDVQHGFTFDGGSNFWYNTLFMRLQYFGILKYIPLFGGLLIGVSQYFPETLNKRIKLTFHLPLKENKAILIMQAFGAVSLLLSYMLLLAIFISISCIYFPSGMVFDSAVSAIPWFLAGMTAYFFVSLVVLEPVWKYRLLYSMIGGGIVNLYLKSPMTTAYNPAVAGLLFLTILVSVAILFPAYRFRKGEM